MHCSENTKDVLVAATYIHLKHREQVKYTAKLPTINPRILLSGPAGIWPILLLTYAKLLCAYYILQFLCFPSRIWDIPGDVDKGTC